jgi:hypothetical protein
VLFSSGSMPESASGGGVRSARPAARGSRCCAARQPPRRTSRARRSPGAII